jgi:hypothetical protein
VRPKEEGAGGWVLLIAQRLCAYCTERLCLLRRTAVLTAHDRCAIRVRAVLGLKWLRKVYFRLHSFHCLRQDGHDRPSVPMGLSLPTVVSFCV